MRISEERLSAIMLVSARMANMLYNLAEWSHLESRDSERAKELVAQWDKIKAPQKRKKVTR